MNMLLPIYEVLNELKASFKKSNTVVLEAPPGAGKTTIVPIEILNETWMREKKILVLEPRRIAARNAAYRMANSLGEVVGETIGYRIRFDTKVSNKTRVEIITEGIFTRKIQSDPELKEVGLIIFDEFHERNIQTDLGLAFALETQSTLREDLRILVMSATLDGKRVSEFLRAPIVRSEGRTYPVEIRYLNNAKERLNDSIFYAIKKALADKGDILVFLPGSGEIRRVQRLLEEKIDLKGILICPLFGDLSQKEQEIAIKPDNSGRRKIILSTNIAESSLTIEGVGIVIDSGLCRIPRFDPSSGMTKLVTANIALDSIAQRTGRAGRLGPGISYRIWSKEEEGHFPEKTKPEILEIELSQFLLEVSSWGTKLSELKLLDQPAESSIKRSTEILKQLNLLDNEEKITIAGKRIALLPLHPRLGYMIDKSKEGNDLYLACVLAAVLNEKNLFTVGHTSFRQTSLVLQIEEFIKNPNSHFTVGIKKSSDELYTLVSQGKISKSKEIDLSRVGGLLSLAYPDRIGRLREKNGRRYKLSSGKGVVLREHDSLEGNEFIVVADLDGDTKESNIFSAAMISMEDIISFHKDKILVIKHAYLDEKSGKISIFEESVLLELVLFSKEIQSEVTSELLKELWKGYIHKNTLTVLNWSESVTNFRKRSEFLRTIGEDLPNVEDNYLLANLDNWLLPYLDNVTKISELKKLDIYIILRSIYTYEQLQLIEREAPEKWEVPSGSNIRLEYRNTDVILSVKLQELFGLLETPRIAKGKIPITFQLLSPSQRPIQITKDIAGFWDRTYLDVKKELMGRYPRHPWPDNPRIAIPTRFTKKKAY